jgi:Bacteriocin-protection, YdeI or OmpD-Associated
VTDGGLAPTTEHVPQVYLRISSPHLRAMLVHEPFFETLDGSNRYAILYRVQTAKKPETRAERITRFVALCARHETIHPRRKTKSGDALTRMVPSQPLIDMFHLFAIGFVWARCSLPLAPLRVR